MPAESSKKIVLIAKDAIPGKVKTRLTTHHSPQAAAQIYQHLALHVCEQAIASEIPVDISFQGDMHSPFAQELASYGCSLYPQQQKSLSHIIHTALQRADRVIALGMDMPLIQPQQLIRIIHKPELIFGPADDGGYWMIAANRPPIELFLDIEWSTSVVLHQSIKRAQELNIHHSLDQIHYDIDTAADLQRLLVDPLLPPSLYQRISPYA